FFFYFIFCVGCFDPFEFLSDALGLEMQEDDMLREQIRIHGAESWTAIAARFKDKTSRQCRRRWYTYLSTDCKKGGWSPEEDVLLCEKCRLNMLISPKWHLSDLVLSIPLIGVHENYVALLDAINGLNGLYCYVGPVTLSKAIWSIAELPQKRLAQKIFGNRWTEIAKVVAGRTDNAVKNRFTTLCKKRAKQEALSKENSTVCINANNKRVILQNGSVASEIFESQVPPLKKIRCKSITKAHHQHISTAQGLLIETDDWGILSRSALAMDVTKLIYINVIHRKECSQKCYQSRIGPPGSTGPTGSGRITSWLVQPEKLGTMTESSDHPPHDYPCCSSLNQFVPVGHSSLLDYNSDLTENCSRKSVGECGVEKQQLLRPPLSAVQNKKGNDHSTQQCIFNGDNMVSSEASDNTDQDPKAVALIQQQEELLSSLAAKVSDDTHQGIENAWKVREKYPIEPQIFVTAKASY
ncbi:SANT SWI3, ADA2, N-CoR and TFIIIB'' DNA-binding domain, partial [Asimina triloba]